ncbi:ORF6C domain-containing protein [Candidatus Uabimicrobium sp. HlEnr_7]|uniref:ORF6C domain-containing protein n=1 Tax=Candidatus Uabimicrobium helgolandensis TaxID=3095367 RepID=UPI0035582B45
MNEKVLLESQSLREELCQDENTNVLERVGELITLNENGYATTLQVASFYQIPVKTLQTNVIRHREEFDQDGYHIIDAKTFKELYDKKINTRMRKIGIFPRRAILRAGMILAKSDIACQIREYLLTTEKSSSPVLFSVAGQLSDQAHVVANNALQLSRQSKMIEQHSTDLARSAQLSNENAQQLILQANLLKAVVKEVYDNKDRIVKNSERISFLEQQYFKFQTDSIAEETIDAQQIQILRDKVKRQKQKSNAVWRKFNRHFSITSYKLLPRSQFSNALLWFEQLG